MATRAHIHDSQHGAGDCVVLLHGLGRTGRSMRKIDKRLMNDGYKVINITYPSTRHSIRELTEKHVRPVVEEECGGGRRTHFVTHSIGGIIARYYLKRHRPANMGRVVMLAPPNKGSEVADFFRDRWIYRALTGPAGQELGTAPDSMPSALGPVDFELGVIAGDRAGNPLFLPLMPGRSDGTVTIDSTAVEGMRDFLVVPKGHTFIMLDDGVLEQAAHFLRNGRFKREH